MRAVCLALLLLLAPAARAEQVEGGKGTVRGPEYACSVQAPPGWVYDDESGAPDGLPVVMYPAGSAWDSSPVVIYANLGRKSPNHELGDAIEAGIEKFRRANPELVVSDAPELITGDGRKAVVKEFRGDRHGNVERVAYIDTPFLVCQVVLSARSEEAFASSLAAFQSVVGSFAFQAGEVGP
ncbi:MAG: hypothetical protein AB1758_26325 [Candidatus Eremiobacterota bacterium]